MFRKLPVDKELIVSRVIQSWSKVLTGMLFSIQCRFLVVPYGNHDYGEIDNVS